MKAVYIVDACRTPIGRYGGALSSVRPDDLLTLALKALLHRNPSLDPAAVEEVFAGAANQSGEDNRNVARMALLMAGLPETVGGVTFNRLCASGLEAVVQAYRALSLGEGMVYMAGGVESMSRSPMVMAKATQAFDRNVEVYDTTLGWRFTNPVLAKAWHPYSMGETAENVAERWKIGREAQDDFAFASHQKWQKAHEAGRWAAELVPVTVAGKKGEASLVERDEHPRPETPREKLGQLAPAFRPGGSVTAGNSSGINDGAAALLLVNEDGLKQFGLKPLARVVGAASAGVDPAIMGVGPIFSTQKLLKRTGLNVADIGLAELNEAFAVQCLAVIGDLGLDPDRVNVNGGAIAMGHPLGCSGARILCSLVHELQRRPEAKYGLATLCVGVGQGLSLMVENLNR